MASRFDRRVTDQDVVRKRPESETTSIAAAIQSQILGRRRVDYADDLMVVLRCTHSTTRLGDWYGNLLRIGHRQMLMFISERSRLPVIIPIRDAKRLATVLPDTVCDVLGHVGVSAKDIAEERSRMSEIAFGPTRNRSLLGTLNDFALMARYVDARRAERESPQELMQFLARTPILPLDGAAPVDLTREAFRR